MLVQTRHRSESAQGRPSCSKRYFFRPEQFDMPGLCVRSAWARGAGRRARASTQRPRTTDTPYP